VFTHAASDGVRLHVEIDGPDQPTPGAPTIVLVHGLAGTTTLAWRVTGVVDRLVAAGLRTVAFDLRGHGRSDAPHDHASYGDRRMAADIGEIIDRFAGPDAVVVGYSMGAALTLLALEAGLRVRAAVAGAVAPAALRWSPDDEAMSSAAVAALEGASEPDEAMQAWLDLLAAMGSDRAALAAVLAGHRPVVEHWDRITVPVVVVAGEDDVMAAPPQKIADRLPQSRVVTVPGDHFSAPATAEFSQAVVEVALGAQ